jgi:hypothetical protein
LAGAILAGLLFTDFLATAFSLFSKFVIR